MDLKDLSTQDLQRELEARQKPKLEKRNVKLLNTYDLSVIEGTIELYSDCKWPLQVVYDNKVYNWAHSIKGSYGEYVNTLAQIVTKKD